MLSADIYALNVSNLTGYDWF